MTDPDPAEPAIVFSYEQIEALYLGAARTGQDDVLEQFLHAGADPDHADACGYTPLILAAYHGHANATDLLLRRGADPDRADAKGSTALAGVAFKGEIAIARRLIEAGATLDAPNHAGRTPLMFAVMFGRDRMAEFLLRQGADPMRRDADGVSAAEVVERQANSRLVARMQGVGSVLDPFGAGP